MKENKYDDNVFFEKYSRMSRSREGLKGAGEWETLQRLPPDFQGRQVLDLGCGYGWHAIYAAEKGAQRVIATDISAKMLEQAQNINRHPRIDYRREAFEDSRFPADSFDIVLCSLMLHYLESFDDFLDKVRLWLKPAGFLVFTVEHPIFTAYGTQDWCYDEKGTILHFPVDHYFSQGKRRALFLGEEVTKYHRTLTTYLDTLLRRGFRLLRVVEPQPSEELLRQVPDMKEELRRPMMLIVLAQKDA